MVPPISCRCQNGREEFDFEYGEDFAGPSRRCSRRFARFLYATTLRATANFNIRQAARLNRLSMYRHETGASRFMFELIVSPERLNCDRLGGDKAAYDLDARPTLMAQTMRNCRTPALNQMCGRSKASTAARIVKASFASGRDAGRDRVGCIILDRGEGGRKVQQWLKTASGVSGFVGFAVNGTTLWNPLLEWCAKKITREEAVNRIATRYRAFEVRVPVRSEARRLTIVL